MHSHHTHEGAPSASTPASAEEVEAARRLLASQDEQEQARLTACAEEIQEVLARHGMRLEVSPGQINLVASQPDIPT